MHNPEYASRTLVQSRAMGVRIGIDDFGTGEAFVEEVGVDTETEAVALAVIAAAKA